MFSNNHHDDGHVAVLVPTADGLQQALIDEDPATYFYPAYVGCKGWIGIELGPVSDEVLKGHIADAWKIISSKK